jgi:hypothetical protein
MKPFETAEAGPSGEIKPFKCRDCVKVQGHPVIQLFIFIIVEVSYCFIS